MALFPTPPGFKPFGTVSVPVHNQKTDQSSNCSVQLSIQTLQKQGKYVTAREYSGCQCNGQDQCDPVYKYPTITLKPRCCPTTPPTPSCPKTCSFEVTAKRGNKNVKESVQGMCSSSFALEQFAGKSGSAAVCPEGYLNSKQPCKAGQDCGVCCVEATSRKLSIWYGAVRFNVSGVQDPLAADIRQDLACFVSLTSSRC